MSAPDPFAHHCVGLTPLPMNRNASRLGAVAAAIGSAPHTGIDSSHGSAMTTPVPRRNMRRDSSREFRRSGLVVRVIGFLAR